MIYPIVAYGDPVLKKVAHDIEKGSLDVAKVSEDMLRLVVEEAQRSSTGIDTGEGRMIKAVLDMQDTEVKTILSPPLHSYQSPSFSPSPL